MNFINRAPVRSSGSEKNSRRERVGDSSFADKLDSSKTHSDDPETQGKEPSPIRKSEPQDRSTSASRQNESRGTETKEPSKPGGREKVHTERAGSNAQSNIKSKSTSSAATNERTSQAAGGPVNSTQAPPASNPSSTIVPNESVKEPMVEEQDASDNGVDREPDFGRSKVAPSIGSADKVFAGAGLPAASLESLRAEKAANQVDETVDMLDAAMVEQGQVKRKAMEDFMSTMKNEFGIAPDKIISAFSKMDDETLMAPPEESTKKFISGLDLQLQPQQEVRAGELYKQMVQTTGDAALNQKLIGLESGVVMDVMSPREQALKKLNQAIDQLDNSFALRVDPNAQLQTNPSVQGQVGDQQKFKAQLAAENLESQLVQLARGGKPNERESEGEDGSEQKIAALPFASALSDSSQTVGGASANGAGASGAAASLANTLQENPEVVSGAGQGSSLASSLASARMSTARRPASAANLDAEKMAVGKKLSGEAKFAMPGGADSAAAATNANVSADATAVESQAPTAVKSAAAGPAGMMMERPTPTAKDEQDNVRELIHQAQTVLKKGGGEIKMDLKPEGMGQVHLKVSVEDGQVSVQMLTESDAAKHLLEKGLHELKSSLAVHQLKLEGLKVDVSPTAQKHMDMEKQGDDQARQQARQFANDVMGQLREERQAFQQGFMENPGWRQYGRPMPRAKMQPETQAVAASSARRSRPDGSGSLDLVA